MTPYLLAIDNGSQSTKVTIFDSRGVPLATSQVISGLSRRTYVDPAFSHVIGYASLRYGTTYLLPSAVMGARLFKFGAQLDF